MVDCQIGEYYQFFSG